MKYGHVILADTYSGFIPYVIKMVTNSSFSHSLITTPNVLNTPMCMEAASVGVSMLSFEEGYGEQSGEDIRCFEVNVPQEIKDAAIKSSLKLLEKSYGYLELLWFIWRAINQLFRRDIKKQDNWSQSGLICSELCFEYLKACGLEHLFSAYGNGSISPEDIYRVMKANPDIFIEVTSRDMYNSLKLNDSSQNTSV